MFQGQSLRIASLAEDGLFELCFDRQGESINKFDERTVDELRQATKLLAAEPSLRGVLVTSAKDVFIVGADITEFGGKFSKPAEQIAEDVLRSNDVFVAFEDLPAPTAVAINGFALGGGLEFALTGAFRAMSEAAQVGVPEVKLGLFPGFGGTVRLVRLAGPATASEWVAGGKPATARAAMDAGVVDDVAPAADVRGRALQWLHRAASGEIDWRDLQARKRQPLAMLADEADRAFEEAHTKALKASGPHQPAAVAAVEMMHEASAHPREAALRLEAQAFGRIARTQAAASMVQTFLSEQTVKKIARSAAKGAVPARRTAVLGAGIMGGGIAVASALKGMSVRMKDLRQDALNQGMAEARKQVTRQVTSGRLTENRAAEVLQSITPQLDSGGFDKVDLMIEAIIENLEIKRNVLAALEAEVVANTVIASNTSSLRIDDIGATLRHPERLVGMHFFNPVPVMPLVEVVRGNRTSDATVATAVDFATALGKTAIVVKDCPGFLVNRVLTAYMRAFLQLVADGADFAEVDKTMEAFGWPMGPAYLEDVVGMDTGSHVNDVISAGYPDRMPPLHNDALHLMVSRGRFGQKSGLGFYRYDMSSTGRPVRSTAGDTHALLTQVQPNGRREFTAAEITDRMMLAMVLEAARALHEGVVGTAAEVDLALQLGLGFPAYAGGPLKYADWLGLREVVRRCEGLAKLGAAYEPDERFRAMATAGELFY